MSKKMYSVGIGKLRQVSLSFLHDVLLNLYNVKVKAESSCKTFTSTNELPIRRSVNMSTAEGSVEKALNKIFNETNEKKTRFFTISKAIINEQHVYVIIEQIKEIAKLATSLIQEWGFTDQLSVGTIPNYFGDNELFEATADDETNKLYLHWDEERLSSDFLAAVGALAQHLRNEPRQPSPIEYLVFQTAYHNISHGCQVKQNNARCLGSPGFRPYTQTYMSLTDPGDGHILGTTRFKEWMNGAIVHVEHLERPRNSGRKKIESYRIPSIFDFARVRLHVGSSAPTTYFVGRCVKDSGVFDDDFLKLVNITAASITAAFYQGAAESKVSMEGLSTSQAVQYMSALRGQVLKKNKQFLSAAWNLNQDVNDDYDPAKSSTIKRRIEIAKRAIEITVLGGFDKIAWDGASDEYPSKCIMEQIGFEDALSIVHAAHKVGLITYFSAGFKLEDIEKAVYAGVDGIGIGGAQVLRYMDKETGMHGPFMEEKIPEILEKRDEAAKTTRGRGVKLLSRLDTMFFEGSISEKDNKLRQTLFHFIKNKIENQIENCIGSCPDVVNMKEEGNEPLFGTAQRLYEAKNPLLKEHFKSRSDWEHFVCHLKSLVAAKDIDSLSEEYYSDPWLSARVKYRNRQAMPASGQTKKPTRDISSRVSVKV